MSKKKEKGVRITFWVPDRDNWIIRVLDKKVAEEEAEGRLCSRADIIREILSKKLEQEIM